MKNLLEAIAQKPWYFAAIVGQAIFLAAMLYGIIIIAWIFQP